MLTAIFGMLGVFWHVLIASFFLYLLLDCEQNRSRQCYCKCKVQKQSFRRKISWSVVVFAIIICMIPYVIGKHYGLFYNYESNGNYYDAECWLLGDFQLNYFGVSILTILFHLIVYLVTLRRHHQTKGYTNAYKVLLNRLLPWIIVYPCFAFFPAQIH